MRSSSALLEIVVEGNGFMTGMQDERVHANPNVCVTVDVHR
jgi:hypothetical protein